MPFLFRAPLLAAAGLLLLLANCQRASYSFPPPALGAAVPVSDSATLGVAAAVPAEALARDHTKSLPRCQPAQLAGNCCRLGKPVAATAAPSRAYFPLRRAKLQRPSRLLRRSPTALAKATGSDAGFYLLFVGGGALLFIAGLLLAFVAGGWLAVVGGLVAVLAGLYLLLIWLFSIGTRGR